MEIKDLKKIGETKKCPYCKKSLEIIPKRKKKCVFCGEFIYVRTRPSDRKKVLVTDKGKEEIEKQWVIYLQIREEKELAFLYPKEYKKAEEELRKKWGTKPTFKDIKWIILQKQVLKYASEKQWGLYRNSKLEMYYIFKNENKNKEALEILFEVCYLDLNGADNVILINKKISSNKVIKKPGTDEFNLKEAFLAPAVVFWIQEIMDVFKLSDLEAKNLFLKVNKERSPYPYNFMPFSLEEAWKKLKQTLKQEVAKKQEMERIDVEEIGPIIEAIKKFVQKEDISNIYQVLNKFYEGYKSKKKIISHPERIKILLKDMLYSKNSRISGIGESFMMFLVKRDRENFGVILEDYIKYIKKNFEKFIESHLIGIIGKYDISLVEDLIPLLIEALKTDEEWNSRRFAAFNLGAIGTKKPELVKKAIP
ncbi:MAG: hypothetical protein L6266_05025, partial [Nanoarchaeota archaeon]|nr:hypothetical protein [Nanoarchaeota archaeon]